MPSLKTSSTLAVSEGPKSQFGDTQAAGAIAKSVKNTQRLNQRFNGFDILAGAAFHF